jgi:ribosomal protein L21
MYAVIKTGGKQYKVTEGDVLKVEKLNAEVNTTVELTEVLLVAGGDNAVKVGKPLVEGAKVVVEVLSQGKGPKVINFKYKPKKASHRKRGHRQLFTEVKVNFNNSIVMTKVEIFRKNGSIVGYKASGHSGYSEQGSDIICSAISTSLQMTLAGIQEVLKLEPKFKINDGFLDVDLKDISQNKFTEINILTESMALFLKELAKQYPKYIRLVEKEEK